MRFKPLLKIENVRDQIQQDRLERSRLASRKGFDLLSLAFQKDYLGRRSVYISEALQAFQEAMRSSGGNPESYIGMAFLLIAFKDYKRALRYLHYGYRLSAQDPDIQGLLCVLERGEEIRLSEQAIDPELNSALQELEGLTFSAIMELMQESPLPAQLTDQDETLSSLEKSQQHWSTVQQTLLNTLSFINPDYQEQQKPLQPLLEHYAHFIRLSRQLIELEREMQTEAQELKRDLWRAETLLSPLEAKVLRADLEHFFDECDRFADDLEQIEAQGFQPAPALDIYDAFMQQVGYFQQVLQSSEKKFTKEPEAN